MELIFETLNFTRNAFNEYLGLQSGDDGSLVLGNISMLESSNDLSTNGIDNRIILSIVNIKEETTLKNGSFYQRSVNNTIVKRRNPPLNLNIFCLFGANNNSYEQGLRSVSRVVSFFQKNYVFTPENAPTLPKDVDKLIFDLHSMSFEELNNMWGYMGGKYLPSVLYRMRLLSIQEHNVAVVPTIDKIGQFTNPQ